MSLYEQWEDLIQNQTEGTFTDFWKKYSDTERNIYSSLLDAPDEVVTGTFDELVKKYEADPVIFMGFLDGVNESLVKGHDLKDFDGDSKVTLDIDHEKLFYNMLVADADYLYTLPQWDDVLGHEKEKEIAKAYKKTKTIIKEKKVGRNDPCPCGSGKKFKKCCGR